MPRNVAPSESDSSSPSSDEALAMKKEKEIVRIEFTPEQKQILKKEIGKEADAVELTVNELEERIAPRMI